MMGHACSTGAGEERGGCKGTTNYIHIHKKLKKKNFLRATKEDPVCVPDNSSAFFCGCEGCWFNHRAQGRSILAAEHTLDLSVSLSCMVLTDPPLSSHNRLAWVGCSAFPQGFPHPITGRTRPLFQVLPIAHNAMEAWLYTC